MDMECPFPECQVEIPTLIVLKAHLVAHNPPLRHRVKYGSLMDFIDYGICACLLIFWISLSYHFFKYGI